MIPLITGSSAFAADRVRKIWAESHLKENGAMRPLAGGRIALRRLSNKGSAGGYFADKKMLVTASTAAATAIVIAEWIRSAASGSSLLVRSGYALIAGGGLGNLYDRLRRGAVTDFISFKKRDGRIGKLVYNVADFAVFAGAALMLAGELIKGKQH